MLAIQHPRRVKDPVARELVQGYWCADSQNLKRDSGGKVLKEVGECIRTGNIGLAQSEEAMEDELNKEKSIGDNLDAVLRHFGYSR